MAFLVNFAHGTLLILGAVMAGLLVAVLSVIGGGAIAAVFGAKRWDEARDKYWDEYEKNLAELRARKETDEMALFRDLYKFKSEAELKRQRMN